MYDYDLLVLGSGPSGQKAAIAASNTLAEAYKVAALDASDKIRNITRIDG